MQRFRWLALFAVTALTLCLPMSTQAQNGSQVTKAQVDAALPQAEKYIEDAQAQTGVPGVAVAIVFQDQVVYLKGFGVREAGKPDPITEDTVFQWRLSRNPLLPQWSVNW